MDAALKAKLGAKWTCWGCARKFYDLCKPQAICPVCGVDQSEAPKVETLPSQRKKSAAKTKGAAKTKRATKTKAAS